MSDPILRITVEDLERGDAETKELPAGEHLVICVEPAHIAYVNSFTNGTTQYTIKRRRGDGEG